MDLAADFSVPLPMMVIAQMLGLPAADWMQFNIWSDVILQLSYVASGGEQAARAVAEVAVVSAAGGQNRLVALIRTDQEF